MYGEGDHDVGESSTGATQVVLLPGVYIRKEHPSSAAMRPLCVMGLGGHGELLSLWTDGKLHSLIHGHTSACTTCPALKHKHSRIEISC